MKNTTKQSKGLVLFITILSLAIMSVGGFYIMKGFQGNKNNSGVGTVSQNNFYTLRKNATPHQKEIYDQLSDALNQDVRDDQKIAGLVAQSFVADFYTWTNKTKFNDVGGLQFIHQDIRKPVFDQALDNIYGDMNYYLQKGDIANTLEVNQSTTKPTTNVKFLMQEEEMDEDGAITKEAITVDAFQVEITWTYKEATAVKTADFQKSSTITIVKDTDGLYSIVEVTDGQPTDTNNQA